MTPLSETFTNPQLPQQECAHEGKDKKKTKRPGKRFPGSEEEKKKRERKTNYSDFFGHNLMLTRVERCRKVSEETMNKHYKHYWFNRYLF